MSSAAVSPLSSLFPKKKNSFNINGNKSMPGISQGMDFPLSHAYMPPLNEGRLEKRLNVLLG